MTTPWTGSGGEIFEVDVGTTDIDEAGHIVDAAAALARAPGGADLILVTLHPRTISTGHRNGVGRSPVALAVPRERLRREGIALAEPRRPPITPFQWPGQIVVHPVFFDPSLDRDPAPLTALLEGVSLDALRSLRVEALACREAPDSSGLWFRGKRIGAVRVDVVDGVNHGGIAINLEGDHAPARYLRDPGTGGAFVTLREILGVAPPRRWVVQALVKWIAAETGRPIVTAPASILERLCSAAPDAKACLRRAQ